MSNGHNMLQINEKGEGNETAVNITSWVHHNKISLGLYNVEWTSHVIVNCLTATRILRDEGMESTKELIIFNLRLVES